MRFILLGAICLLFVSSWAQDLSEQQRTEMLDCAVHRKEKWVDAKLYSDGKLRFSYVLELPVKKGPSTLYVAFWNQARTEGKLVQFHVSKTPKQRDSLAIVNDGWIWDNKGRPDVRDTMGGLYTYHQIKDRLPNLKRGQLTVVDFDQLITTSASCSSPLDYVRPKDGQKSEK